MKVLKDGRFLDDVWVTATDTSGVAADVPLLVDIAQWRRDRDVLSQRSGPLALRLVPEQAPEQVADDLGFFAMVALEFPKFTDGRAYSHARNLRDRFGYQGEVRAVGNVLRDQLPLMQRCGFDAFLVPERAEQEGWISAFEDISVVTQPSPGRSLPGKSGTATVSYEATEPAAASSL
jgi:uncharacterized protein (DUF934 family)